MPMIPVFHVQVSSHLHSRIAKKLNTHKFLVFLGIHHRQINKSRKYKQQLLLRKLRPRLAYACTLEIYSKGFPFLYITNTQIQHIFLFKRLALSNSQRHFKFLRFTYFQFVFSLFSFSSDSSTHFQIETPILINSTYVHPFSQQGPVSKHQVCQLLVC